MVEQRIIIVGGGTAGWLAACVFAKHLGDSPTTITLVESEAVGIIGVGEATIPAIRGVLSFLDIPEAAFLQATDATFKLGIDFVGWSGEGSQYMHPFGGVGLDFAGLPFHQHFLKSLSGGMASQFEDFSPAAQAARAGRFSTEMGKLSPIPFTYAYHFDSSKVAKFLRSRAEQLGVCRCEGLVDQVEKDQNGSISAIRLNDGRCIEGDMFIDCSGMQALLSGQALEVPFQDWSDQLLCDRAVAVQSSSAEVLPPFTKAIAEEAGWRWRIPLRSRDGNGYVYSSRHISESAAEARLLESLEHSAITEPRHIRFRPGRREAFWVKNCVSIGLSSGFLEPLESTSIHLAQLGIFWLLPSLSSRKQTQFDVDDYNRAMSSAFDQARDFILLHYLTAKVPDAEFWSDAAAVEIPESLFSRMQRFKETALCPVDSAELFAQPSWLAVMLGQGVIPESYSYLADYVPEFNTGSALAALRVRLASSVAQLPHHREFLASIK